MLFELLLGLLLCLYSRDIVVAQICEYGSVRVVSYQCDSMYVYSVLFSSHHLLPMELLKPAGMIFGVAFVLIPGITMMLVLSASNWDTLLMVTFA